MSKELIGMPTDEYNDIVYRYTYYALQGIAPKIPRSIHPNQISFFAFLCSLASCACLYFISTPAAYLYWVLFNTLWYIFDALDGMHARISQQTSEFGGFLDHFFDVIFFMFMFTIFVIKFNLLHTFYIFIILMRFTVCTIVFLVQNHTGKMYLSKFSGGLELLLMTAVMVFSYCFPHLNLVAMTSNPVLHKILLWLSLDSGVFMKLVLLFYFVGVIPAIIQQYLFAKRHLCS